jgi:plasmid stabilization system protein ParE
VKVRFTDDAEVDFGEIGEYIARDDIATAREFLGDLKAFILRIASAPSAYRVRSEWSGEVRAARFGSYLVIFELEAEGLVVLRIVNGRRNIARLLREARR